MPDGDVQTSAAQTAIERGCGSTKRPSSMLVAAVVGALRVMAAGYLPLRGIMQREARHERVATSVNATVSRTCTAAACMMIERPGPTEFVPGAQNNVRNVDMYIYDHKSEPRLFYCRCIAGSAAREFARPRYPYGVRECILHISITKPLATTQRPRQAPRPGRAAMGHRRR